MLDQLGNMIREASLCGLGQTAPNPVLSTLRYFRDEYDSHVESNRCPAGVCNALTKLKIVEVLCKACGGCVKVCPTDAINGGEKKVPANINQDKCIICRACLEVCKFNAVVVG